MPRLVTTAFLIALIAATADASAARPARGSVQAQGVSSDSPDLLKLAATTAGLDTPAVTAGGIEAAEFLHGDAPRPDDGPLFAPSSPEVAASRPILAEAALQGRLDPDETLLHAEGARIPEPASVILLLTGAISGLIARRRLAKRRMAG